MIATDRERPETRLGRGGRRFKSCRSDHFSLPSRVRTGPDTMRIGLLSLAVVAVLLSAPAAAQEWKKYSYRDDGFEIEFPAAPKLSPTVMSEQDRATKFLRTNDYTYEGAELVYTTSAVLLSRTQPDLERGSNATFAALTCKTTVSDRSIQQFKVRSRELIGSMCIDQTFRIELRVFAKGNWFYQVLAAYKENGGDVASARRFLDSFRLY